MGTTVAEINASAEEDSAASPVELALASLSERIAADDQIPVNLKTAILSDLKSDNPAALVSLKTALAAPGEGNAS